MLSKNELLPFAAIAVVGFIVVAFFFCWMIKIEVNNPTPRSHHKADDWSPSTVITPNGNMGLEVAPGVAIDMSSGEVGPSFGF